MFIRLFFQQYNNCFRLFPGEVLRRNLCNTVSRDINKTTYRYLLFLDLEATCEPSKSLPQEIIEFPCIKVNASNFTEEARFHHYVRPVLHPILSRFCIELTGILQEVVDNAQTFPEVLQLFEEWRQQEGLTGENSLYVTSGDWDLGHMMPKQCAHCDLEIPSHMKEWVDIKKLFGNNNKKFYNSFASVMQHYGLEFQGRSHSGIADTLNMVRAGQKMLEEGIEFQPTSRLVNLKVEHLIKPIKVVESRKMSHKRRKIMIYQNMKLMQAKRNPVATGET